MHRSNQNAAARRIDGDTSLSDAERAVALIEDIIAACPRRLCGTADELRAQGMLKNAFKEAGARTHFHEFRWNTSHYAVMALHFGLACLGTALFFWHPLLGAAAHTLAAVSYLGDSTRRYYLLRRLFPFEKSQNLVATLPAKPSLVTPDARAPVRRRIVLVGHADAAYTGWLFHPTIVRHATKEPPLKALGFLRKGLLLATAGCVLLAVVDVAWFYGSPLLGTSGTSWPIGLVLGLLSIAPFVAFAGNLQVVLHNTIVPGANDNLTGCTGAWILCERLAADKPDDVEIVFVCTGAEEAGTGGAYNLARDVDWSRDDTVVLAIDGLTNGDLQLYIDGEIIRTPPPTALLDAAKATRDTDPRFSAVGTFEIPSGATDAMPFLAQRFAAMGVGCVDPDIGAPRNYHLPTDTPDRLDVEQFAVSLDYLEALVRNLWREEGSLATGQ